MLFAIRGTDAAVTPRTPGIADRSSSTRAKSAAVRAESYALFPGEMPNVVTFSMSMPRSTRLMFRKLSMKSPAAMRSAIDNAICAVTRLVRKRAAPRPPANFPELFRNSVTRSGRVLWSAGTIPNNRPVSSEITAVNHIAGRLNVNSSPVTTRAGSSAATPFSVQ